eukprot:6847761-Pyramimonas_sp.AAC.1
MERFWPPRFARVRAEVATPVPKQFPNTTTGVVRVRERNARVDCRREEGKRWEKADEQLARRLARQEHMQAVARRSAVECRYRRAAGPQACPAGARAGV